MDLQRLVHELQVHQIELELQNEELQRAWAEMEAGLERYTDLYDFAPVGYFTLDRSGQVLQVNLSGARQLSLERARLVGKNFILFVHPDGRPDYLAFLEQVLASQVKEASEVMLLREGGEPFWAQIEAITARSGGEYRIVVMDIDARKKAEFKIQYISMHDALTGLYNRSFFEESMRQLERGRQYPISLIMADVDHLKLVNDRLGHDAGDAVLKRTAQVLTETFRSEDVIARIGGDEFCVLLPNTPYPVAAEAMARLRTVLQDHNIAFAENPLKISFGMSTAEAGVP